MGRPKRVKNKSGTMCVLKEVMGDGFLELFASPQYEGQRLCLSIGYGDQLCSVFQTNVNELEQIIAEFKELRGIKRVRKQAPKGQG